MYALLPQVSYMQGKKKVQTTCKRLLVSGVQTQSNCKCVLANLDGRETEVFKQVS